MNSPPDGRFSNGGIEAPFERTPPKAASNQDLLQYDRLPRAHRTVDVKQAILATVISVEKQSLDSVLVRLQSDALEDAGEIVSTGLNLERTKKRSGSRLEVTCKGDPKAKPGDKVPVIVRPEKRDPVAHIPKDSSPTSPTSR